MFCQIVNVLILNVEKMYCVLHLAFKLLLHFRTKMISCRNSADPVLILKLWDYVLAWRAETKTFENHTAPTHTSFLIG